MWPVAYVSVFKIVAQSLLMFNYLSIYYISDVALVDKSRIK